MSTFSRVSQSFWEHWYFYRKFLYSSWDNITPMQYGGMLVAIAVIGYLLMKSSAR